MNTSRVPGVSRNSGWQVIDAEIASRRGSRWTTTETVTVEKETARLHPS